MFVTFALALSQTAQAASPAQARGDAFEPVPCATFHLASTDFQCGYVRVPELHAQPNGATIRLGVAILPSTGTTPTRDAFVVAQGGPGGSTIDSFADFFEQEFYPALASLRATRDIVLYDQRGTLYAQPALLCPEEITLEQQTMEQALTPQERLRRSVDAAVACRARLVGAGVNLAAYNSFENALDIEDLRRALGYAQFDFYGVSYGTLLALHGMRETPQTFRSVTLDAVVPAQLNPNVTIAQTQNRAFEQLFSACAADAECDRAYPDLKQVFYGLVDALDKSPARVAMADRTTGARYNAVLDGGTMMGLFFQFIYSSEIIPALPRMIYSARDGNYDLLGVYWSLTAFDRTFASGMYYSVMCAEDADFALDDLAVQGVDEHLARAQQRDTAAFLEVCAKWDVPALGPLADDPVHSTIPTLALSGNFDPITPPPFGAAATTTINPSFAYDFPAYAHGALTSGNCPDAMVVSFIQHPTQGPDAQCLLNLGAVQFITPTTYLLSYAMGRLQYAMLKGQVQQFVLPLLLLAVVLSTLVIGPLAWLVRHVRHRAWEASRAARLAPWLAGLAGILAALFLTLWSAIVLGRAFTQGEILGLLLGLPRQFALLFAFPPAYAVCAVGLAAAVGLACRSGSWGVARRAYYGVVALAALGLLLWFALNGILTVLLT